MKWMPFLGSNDMRKYTILIFALLLFLCGCTTQQPQETTASTEAFAATEIGNSAYSCITGESEIQEVTSDGEAVMVKAFSHKIYDPDNEYVVTLTTAVTFPAEEGVSEITAVSGSLSDAQADGFTVSEHLSGDTATIVVYRNQMSVCHFQYRVYSDGSVELLAS